MSPLLSDSLSYLYSTFNTCRQKYNELADKSVPTAQRYLDSASLFTKEKINVLTKYEVKDIAWNLKWISSVFLFVVGYEQSRSFLLDKFTFKRFMFATTSFFLLDIINRKVTETDANASDKTINDSTDTSKRAVNNEKNSVTFAGLASIVRTSSNSVHSFNNNNNDSVNDHNNNIPNRSSSFVESAEEESIDLANKFINTET